jgi:hypothetical protein
MSNFAPGSPDNDCCRYCGCDFFSHTNGVCPNSIYEAICAERNCYWEFKTPEREKVFSESKAHARTEKHMVHVEFDGNLWEITSNGMVLDHGREGE